MKVLRPPFDRPEVLAKLRPAYLAARSLMLPAACDPRRAPRPRLRAFDLAHRGNYAFADLRDQPLADELCAFAEALACAPLRLHSLRLYRFRRGGYSLFRDDAATRIETGIEVTLDLSRKMAGPPAVYQSSASHRLEVPQAPGLVAVVERNPGLFRYDRYLPAEVGRAEVLRLRAAFVAAD